MLFKYKGKSIEVPNDFIMMCGQHAEKRGMTLEEYIAEAFDKLKREETNRQRKERWNEEEANRRMDIIGQNGNDGLHYDEAHEDCGTDECCNEC